MFIAGYDDAVPATWSTERARAAAASPPRVVNYGARGRPRVRSRTGQERSAEDAAQAVVRARFPSAGHGYSGPSHGARVRDAVDAALADLDAREAKRQHR